MADKPPSGNHQPAGSQQSNASAADPFNPNSFNNPAMITDAARAAATSIGKAPVKLLAFDMGHVFVDFEWEEVCRGFYTRTGHSEKEFKAALAHAGSLGYERGKVGTQEFLDDLNQQLGTTISVDEFKLLWNNTFRENPEMAALLQSLKNQVPLYLLSNINEVHHAHLQETYNVERHFHELIFSYQVGMAKPDQAIYEEVVKRSGIPAENCVFIDDLLQNVDAAQKVGMQTILFTGINDLKPQLQSLGFVVS